MAKILQNEPVREAIASIPNYHDSVGASLQMLEGILAAHQLAFCSDPNPIIWNDEARETIELIDLEGDPIMNADLVVHWHKMPSGRLECVAYIS